MFPGHAPQDLDMTGLKEGHVHMFLNKKAKVLSESAGELWVGWWVIILIWK